MFSFQMQSKNEYDHTLYVEDVAQGYINLHGKEKKYCIFNHVLLFGQIPEGTIMHSNYLVKQSCLNSK